ncbi:MAG: DNA-binding response regulator, partial [Actinomyces sp.]
LQRGLEAEGFAVDVAHDGEEGLWLARENSYDAIVLDLMLPKINGYKVCRTLREEGDWTPILMLTAKNGELDEAEGLDTGADDFVTKPFSFVVLVSRLRAVMRRRHSVATPILEAGDLRLDTATGRVQRGDTPIDLTPRERAVLEVLLTRRGHIVSKQEILDAVWDWAYDGSPNIVEVYISNLRRKIDTPFDRHAIETVRGAGYRLARDGG